MSAVVRGSEERSYQSLPKSARVVNNGAFSNMDQLSVVRLNEGLEALGDPDRAFEAPEGARLFLAGKEAEARMRSGAFQDSSVRRVVLPTSLRRIERVAFEICRNLSKIDLPPHLERLAERGLAGTAISTVRVPGSLKEIGPYAFLNCRQLQFAQLCEGVENSGYEAFWGTSLCSVQLPASLREIWASFSEAALLREVWLPCGKMTVAPGAEKDCGKDFRRYPWTLEVYASAKKICVHPALRYFRLTALEFHEGSLLEEIGGGTFAKTELEKFHGTPGLQRIGPLAFAGCKGLKEIVWGPNVREVGDLCFLDVPVLPVKNDSGFPGFLALTSRLPTRRRIADLVGDFSAGQSAPAWKAEMRANPKNFGIGLRQDQLRDLVLPAGLQVVDRSWFRDLEIRHLVIPRSVRELGSEAFCCDRKLSSVEIEQGSALERIGSYCFYRCRLREFRVPARVRLIDDFAFYHCERLRMFTFEAAERDDQDTRVKVRKCALGLTRLRSDRVEFPAGAQVADSVFMEWNNQL